MNMTNKIKIIALIVAIAAGAAAGTEFYRMWNFREPSVIGEQTTVKKLSDYDPQIKGANNDCNVYVIDSGVPGGTLLLFGGTHPEEPASNITSSLFLENAKLEAGRLIVINRGNRSASLTTRNGEAYPSFCHVKTPWGEKTWRTGDRCANQLDSWPDPEVYIHYPSRQMLAYMDIRNFNRTWPGRENGLLAERTCAAFIKLIEAEKVDVFIDLHEAELEYPVINTVVTHEKGQEIAAMVSMTLTSEEFDVPLNMEFSPKALHGLSHREVGDHSRATSLLFEVAEPFLDRIRGITDEKLLMTGKDEFVVTAGKHGLLYSPIDENGWPIELRVGRHSSSVQKVSEIFTMLHPDLPIVITNVPKYKDIKENGLGGYFHDPSEAPADRVVYD